MMKHMLMLFTALLCSLVGSSIAGLDVLENIGSDSTVVTTRFIDGVMVTVSTEGGFPMLACTYNESNSYAFTGADGEFNVPLNPGNVSGTRFISSYAAGVNSGFPEAHPIIFQFDQPVTFFGLTTLDLCENDDPAPALKLQAYDASNNLIVEHSRSGSQGPSGLDLDWGVSGNGIVKVVLTGTISEYYPGYGIDDLVLISNGTVTAVREKPKATQINLHQNYPNPFNPSTTIEYSIKERAHISLEVYNVAGQLVKTLVNEYKYPGTYTQKWNGRNNSGHHVSSGVYFYRLKVRNDVLTKRMVLLK